MFHGVIQKITVAQFFLRHGVYLNKLHNTTWIHVRKDRQEKRNY